MDELEPPKKKSRTIASQACDSCRQRKIRCLFREAEDGEQGSGSVGRRAVGKTCRGCEDVGLPCTFDMPVKRRGPLSKVARANGQAKTPSTPDQSSNSPKPPVLEPQPIDINSAPRTPFPINLPSPYDLGSNVQLPPIHGHSPQLFHLRYTQKSPPVPSSLNHASPTDLLCPREMFEEMMQDYLDFLYPLVPIVHIPTFTEDLKNRREGYDKTFLSLVISICAAVVAHVPSRFYHYKSQPTPLRFANRSSMTDFCYEYILSLRKASYFDEPTFTKFAISYMLGIAEIHLGMRRSRLSLMTAETMQLSLILEFHSPALNDTFNCIEMQLRKKAFWLCFFGFVHHRIEISNPGMLVQYDEQTLESISIDSLLPSEVDDEYITPNRFYSQPAHKPALTIGFNANCRIFWAAVTNRSNKIFTTELRSSPIPEQLSSLQVRLQRVKHALDSIFDLHPQLSRWNVSSPMPPCSESEVLDSQWESMRANIHVGNLWLQSMLFDQIVSLTESAVASQTASLPPSTAAAVSSRSLWNEREDICRQLLNILYNISAMNLEPNGNVLVNKIRAVATTLLDCPFEQQGDIARRAHKYITNFADLLSRIDNTSDVAAQSSMNQNADVHTDTLDEGGHGQSVMTGTEVSMNATEIEEMERMRQQFWNDLDQHSRRGISEFSSIGSERRA